LLLKSWDIINDERSSEKSISNALHVALDCCRFLRELMIDGPDIVTGTMMYLEDQERERRYNIDRNQSIEAIERDRRNSQAIF